MAGVLATLPPESALPRLEGMLDDTDQRVVPAVVRAIVALKADEAAKIALDRLEAEDVVVRIASAEGVGELKPPNGAAALAEAYRRASGIRPTWRARPPWRRWPVTARRPRW